MQRHHIIECDFFARSYVAQCVEEYVAVKDFHVAIGLARVIDVMRAVSPATAVNAPLMIDSADTQHAAMARSACRFRIVYQLARVLGDFSAAPESNGRKAALAVDLRFMHGEAMREFHLHGKSLAARALHCKRRRAAILF